MSNTPQTSNEPNILGSFASVVGLLGASLYFTGWIYRWAYFNFFQLKVTTLDLPVESFLLVPLQVLLGNGWAICKTVIASILTAFAIYLTLWLIQTLSGVIAKKLANWQQQIINYYAKKRKKSGLDLALESLAQFGSVKLSSINFLRSLIDEIVIVAWVLIALFWLARSQGIADARLDAVNSTSTLPVITLITPENRIALGRKLDNPTDDPSLKGYRIIGDKGLFDNLQGQEINDTTNPKQSRVWRLLVERGGWIYLFPALASNADRNQRPPVLAIQESEAGEQVMILSPEASELRK